MRLDVGQHSSCLFTEERMNAVLRRFFMSRHTGRGRKADLLLVRFSPGPFPDPSGPGFVIRKILSGQPAGNLVGTDARETAPLDGLVAAMLIQALDRQGLAVKSPEFRDPHGGVDRCSVRLRSRDVDLDRK